MFQPRFLAACALLATLLGAATAPARSAPPAGVQRIATVEGVTEYRLKNGLQVLLYPDAAKPTVTVNITYRVGSRHENYGETGMAHLLEHLIFKGSRRYPSPDKEFKARGFRNNGTTWLDRTNYFSTFKASDDNLRWALGWSADAMVNSFIARKDLDSEMTVVRNEFEMGESSPGRVMFKRMQATVFDWHNYGNSTIGNRSDIENVGIENLRAFYRTYYQPDNATLIVAGNFDEARTLQWIAEAFGRIPAPRRKLPALWTAEPVQDGERSFVVRRAGDVQIVMAAYRAPAGLSRDAVPLDVAAQILGDTPNGRLHRELVDKGLATSVFGYTIAPRDPGMVMFGATVKKGESVEAARARMIEVVEGTFGAVPPTAEELARVKRDVETQAERTLADPQDFGIGLSEFVALGDWRLFFQSRDAVAATDGAAVAAAAARYFRRDNRTLGTFVPDDQPQRAEIPAPLAPAALLEGFTPRAAAAAGEVFDPSPANIDRRTRRVAIGELNLALLPKKNRGETVNVALDFQFGDERSLAGKSVVAQLTAAMLSRGSTRLSRQQIADEQRRLKMEGSLTSFRASRGTVVEALELVAHVLREPAFAPAEFEQLKKETLTALQSQLNDPAQRSRDALLSHFNTYPPGDPRYYLPLSERLAEVERTTLEDVRAFHASHWGTARGEAAVVGDFDPAAVEQVFRTRFAAWSSPAPYARILSEPRTVPTVRQLVATPDRENAMLAARLNVALRDDDPDAPALMLADRIFGGGSGLSNRLIDRVRQKEGLSYGAWSSLALNGFDRAAWWQLAAIAAPQNLVRLETAVREEFDRMVRDGFTQKEVDDARNGYLQSRVLARSEDAQVAAAWVRYLDQGRSFAFGQQLEDAVRKLTPAELAAAVRRHLEPGRLSVFVAGDPGKGAK